MIDIVESLENQSEKVPFLGYKEYLTSLDGASYSGYVIDGKRILPFVEKRRLLFKIIQIPCSACGCETTEEKLEFVNDAIKLLCKTYSPDVIHTLNTNICSVYPDHSEYCKFGSYIIDLGLSEDELFNNIHPKHRNVVRKAMKDGLTVMHGKEFAEECDAIISQTYERQGSKAGRNAQLEALKGLDNVDFWIVKDDEETQGCAVLFWSKGFSSYYIHGGSIAHPHGGALNLLHWEAIKEMKRRGVHYYDFVGARINPSPGSKLEGIQRFKSRFGGPMEVGYMWRHVNHPVRYFLYKTTMRLYLRYIKGNRIYTDIINEERKKGNY